MLTRRTDESERYGRVEKNLFSRLTSKQHYGLTCELGLFVCMYACMHWCVTIAIAFCEEKENRISGPFLSLPSCFHEFFHNFRGKNSQEFLFLFSISLSLSLCLPLTFSTPFTVTVCRTFKEPSSSSSFSSPLKMSNLSQ